MASVNGQSAAKGCRSVVLITDEVCARVSKIGFALRLLGWRVILLHRDPVTLSDAASCFTSTTQFHSNQEAVRLAFAHRPALFHVFSSWNFDLAAMLVSERPGPVVFDDYDIMAGIVREPFARQHYPGQLEKERYCLENADGICCRSLELKMAKRRLGYRIGGRQIFFQDYCWDRPSGGRQPRRLDGDELHLVYCGNVAIEKYSNEDRHRCGFFLEAGRELSEAGVHLHLYPAPIDLGRPFEEVFSDHLELARRSRFFHLHRPVAPDLLIGELSQYHLGIHSSWSDEPQNSAYHPEKLVYASANKIFDYFDAGLGVVIDRRRLQNRVVMRIGAGVESHFDGLAPLLRSLPRAFFSHLRARALSARRSYSVVSQIPRLVRFYDAVSERRDDQGSHLSRAYELFAAGELTRSALEAESELRLYPGNAEASTLLRTLRLMGMKE